MAELHLIGTLAQDPDGLSRLVRLLDDVQPDVVAVEAAQAVYDQLVAEGGAGVVAIGDALAGRGADAATVAFWRRRLEKSHLHFEVFGAASYAAGHARPLVFIEAESALGEEEPSSAAAAEAAAFLAADLDRLQAIAAYDWRGDYTANYARARVDLEAKACLEFLLPVAQHAAYHAHTQEMANRLAPLIRQPGKVAVVCGLTQLYFSEARLTLYSQLYEATAERYVTDGIGHVRDHAIVLPWKSAGDDERAVPGAAYPR